MNPNKNPLIYNAPDPSSLPYAERVDILEEPKAEALVNPLTTQTPSSVSVRDDQKSEKVDKIVQNYLILNKLFFGIGIYVIVGIIALLIAWKFSLPDTTFPFPMRSNEILSKEEQMKDAMNIITQEDSKINDLLVIVKQGDLSLSENNLISINNLVTYKGFTLPRKTSITVSASTGELQKSSYFVAGLHSLTDLDNYLKKIIYNNYISTPDTPSNVNRSQLVSTQYPLANYFGIQCILSPRPLGNVLCDQVLEQTLPSLSVYVLANHYDELLVLAKKIQGTPKQELFCESVKHYLFLSNDLNASVKEVMETCGKKYSDVYSEFSSFRTIQDQLSKQSIQSNVTTSALLNSYKLVSVMQEIYSEVKRGNNINDLRISSYIEYVRSLLKNTQAIQGFYMDVISRYNTTFLSPLLSQNSVSARGEESAIYRKLLLDLNELSEGNLSKGFTGLNYLVSDPMLSVIASGGTYVDIPVMTGEILLSDTFTQNYTFDNYIVKELIPQQDLTIQSVGVLRFAQNDGLANNTPLSIVFVYKNQKFYAQSIVMPRHPLLASTINPRLAVAPLSISELYTLIIQTQKGLPTTSISTDVCGSFKKDKDMVSCTSQTAKFVKNRITYLFNYTPTQGVVSYSISNALLEQQVKALYGSKVTLTKNPVEAITIILDYEVTKPSVEDTTDGPVIGGAQEVQLQKNYDDIGATVTKISKSDTYYIVEFQNHSYAFKSVYEPSSHKIIGIGIMIGESTYPLRNFTFDFTKASVSEKELFKNDPRTLLLQYDPLTTKKWLK